MANTIIAVGIKKLYYFDTSLVTEDLTGSKLYALIEQMTEITNVHQDTWSLEESEASITGYKNQLTGKLYRQDKEEGEVTINFTIGEYDYATKAALLGGTATDTSWKRSREKFLIEKGFYAITEDDQHVVVPRANVVAREATGDKAVQLPVRATELEPKDTAIAAEYWFDGSEVVASA